MATPDFYFAVNALSRYLHDRYGHRALIDYWRSLGREYYHTRCERWRNGGVKAIASDWQSYFKKEPKAKVDISIRGETVELIIHVCPAIKHLKDCGREIVPYFCEHCDSICGAMAGSAGFSFKRTGGMGSCRQRFVQVGDRGKES